MEKRSLPVVPPSMSRPLNEGLEKGGVNRPPSNSRPPGVPGATAAPQPNSPPTPTASRSTER
jgi:hypothetical protein